MWRVVAAYGGERYLHPALCLIAICVYAVYLLYIEKEQKKVIRGGSCQTNKNMSAIGE